MKHILFVEYNFPSNTPFLRYKFEMMARQFSVTFASREGRSARVKFAHKYPSQGHLLSMLKPTQRPVEFLLTLFIYCFTKPVTLFQFLLFCIKKKGKKEGMKWFLQTFPLIKKPWSLIHFEFGTISRELIFIADFFKAQTITSFRGYDIAYVGLDDPSFYSEVWKKSTAIHFLGNDLLQKGIDRGFDISKQFFLIPPAIFPDKFPGKFRTLPTDRTQPIQIVSVGRLTWKKGYVFGLMAIKNLIEEGFNIQYQIIGSGEDLQAIQYHIHDMGLSNFVSLEGRKSPDEVANILNKAHLFLHPAVSEGFCNAVVEAQAMGLPVICSDAEGLSENIEDGETGYLFSRRNASLASELLKKIIEDPALYASMNAAGPKRVATHFDIKKQVATFSDIYRKMLN